DAAQQPVATTHADSSRLALVIGFYRSLQRRRRPGDPFGEIRVVRVPRDARVRGGLLEQELVHERLHVRRLNGRRERAVRGGLRLRVADPIRNPERDRKSTRLNSSHLGISYAVFCLKKKKK